MEFYNYPTGKVILSYALLGGPLGGFILVDSSSSLGGFGEITLFVIGIGFGAVGLKNKSSLRLPWSR